MSRSLKKGPFIDPKLEAKVVAQAEGNKKAVMVGHKLGEFAPTRNFRGHAGNKKK